MPDRHKLNWATISAVSLIILAVALVVVFDVRTGGEATPDPYLGEIGTPVRYTYVPDPTFTPREPTPRPQATVPVDAPGTPEERDAQRRSDLLGLLAAANEYRARNGEYPDTGGNIQSLCAYKELDVGCALRDILGEDPPEDPLGEPLENGYWYASDGVTVTIYAALELEVPEADRCPTDNPDLLKKPYLICIKGP